MSNSDEEPMEEPYRDEEEVVWRAENLMRASYKDLGTPHQVQDRFMRYLLKTNTTKEALKHLFISSSSTTRDYSLEIDTFDLIQQDTVLGCLVLRFPTTLLPLLEKSIVMAQHQLFTGDDQLVGTVKGDTTVSMSRVHARLIHLPPTCTKSSLNHMEAADVGKIWQVQGTVVRSAPVQMYESARTYKCTGKKGCGRTFVVDADLEQCHNALVKPEGCPLMGESGQVCGGQNLQVEGSVHTDYQEIKIQEAASRIGMGHIPRSLLIKLEHDLVDTCQPGDEVVIVGSLLAQWPQSTMVGVDCPIGMALKAHSIRVVQEKGGSVWNDDDVGEMDRLRKEFDDFWNSADRQRNPIAARDFICKAVAPQLYGLAMIKLSLLVTLIGGVPSSSYHEDSTDDGAEASSEPTNSNNEPEQFRIHHARRGNSRNDFYHQDNPHGSGGKEKSVKTRRRDQSHMLLVGDPGTAKSQILRFAGALCPRSVMTTGVGTTSAGLTCAAVREGNGKDFVLEAGALVLADKGVCCIDEFGCIRKEDRTTIHEAMEQQTLSVAKGGIVCKLNCRATVIAVMNPKDCLYDNHASLSRNTGLGTPLLSRFDIIFKMVDSSDASRDSHITTYLLNRAITGAGFRCNESNEQEQEQEEAPWSMDKLRAYISIVKDRFNPALGEDAAILLERHYEKCRSTESDTIPITVRFLESMIRLSQAHARLMYRDVVTLEDAIAVVRIMECSAFAYGGFDGMVDDVHNILYRDPMTMEFSGQADVEFLVFELQILERYGLIERMNPGDRRKALDYMNGSSHAASSGWGDSNGSSPWQAHAQQSLQQTVQQDHYGRMQFTAPSQRPESSSGSDSSKRRRTGM